MLGSLLISRDYADLKRNNLSDVESWVRSVLNCKCEFNLRGELQDRSVYDYLCTSLTSYEKEIMNSELVKVENSLGNKSISIPRVISANKYFLTDSTFPLYRGLLCLRNVYSASKGIDKYITTQEINLYKHVIQLIYIYDKSGHLYSEQLVRSLYTEFEYEVLMPELLAAVCLNVISDEEFDLLLDLLQRDPIVKIYIKNAQDTCLSMYGSQSMYMGNTSYLRLTYSDNELFKEFFKEIICIMLKPLFKLVIDSFKPKSSTINMKSVSDFRVIFELCNSYNKVEIELITNNNSEKQSSIKIVSTNCVDYINSFPDMLENHRKGVKSC